jgi:hypothetical protein
MGSPDCEAIRAGAARKKLQLLRCMTSEDWMGSRLERVGFAWEWGRYDGRNVMEYPVAANNHGWYDDSKSLVNQAV